MSAFNKDPGDLKPWSNGVDVWWHNFKNIQEVLLVCFGVIFGVLVSFFLGHCLLRYNLYSKIYPLNVQLGEF